MDFPVTFELKKVGTSTDSEGVPKLTLTFEVIGRGAFERIDFGELMSMAGKQVLLVVKDTQLRLATQG